MIQTVPLTPDAYYHIYNRGNNKEVIFKSHEDYWHFLKLVQKYILPSTEIYCYSLLSNHFHLLVKVKCIKDSDDVRSLVKPSQAFSNLFNAYARHFNYKYERTGKLFSESFKRIEVKDPYYLIQLVYYIHANPQRHRLCRDFRKYPYSSYPLIKSSVGQVTINTEEVFDWFGGKASFLDHHNLEQAAVEERLLSDRQFKGLV